MTAYQHEDDAFYALLAPTTQDDDALFLTVTVSDGTNSQDLTLTGIPPTEAGNSYSFKLTVGKDYLTMGEVKVTPWTEGTAIAVKELLESSINGTTLTMTVYNATPEETKAVIADALEANCRTLDITLPTDASAEMITAIRRAICDNEDVADGSINLTLKGVTSIPSNVDDEGNDGVAFGSRYEQYDDNGDEIVPYEEVTQLKSVNLPDVTYIGSRAFSNCSSLTTITAPKVQTVEEQAFEYTALTSVELPKATTIEPQAFVNCRNLSSVKLPSATRIGGTAFAVSENITYLELTAEGTITFGNDAVFNDASSGANFEGNIDLVLHANKQDQVSGNTWTTTHDVLGNVSYTFNSITFK